MTHPIQVPSDLVEDWSNDAHVLFPEEEDKDLADTYADRDAYLANQAAQWGADLQLYKCCEWVGCNYPLVYLEAFRADMRPKPPSLKEQALRLVSDYGVPNYRYTAGQTAIIRRAIESIPDNND